MFDSVEQNSKNFKARDWLPLSCGAFISNLAVGFIYNKTVFFGKLSLCLQSPCLISNSNSQTLKVDKIVRPFSTKGQQVWRAGGQKWWLLQHGLILFFFKFWGIYLTILTSPHATLHFYIIV